MGVLEEKDDDFLFCYFPGADRVGAQQMYE